ncbi:MAG TPA: DUF3788 family protein [Candidatus Pullichristensenella excrementigallinarum]|uniref:DUF3788 family protein n=1 Tax=Candidatus Pullichristensenella excrementigallinarum TaxID=2840907 RepID=A0A9D1IBY8_9FIRM|nr:DUF3788 family protein [Candidatus Pullichristensenella excrementigallinarum]
MEQLNIYTHPVPTAPTNEELRAMLGDRAYPACKAVRDFCHANYALEERWRYSDTHDAFDCLFFAGEKRLCSLHLLEGTFLILLLLNENECEAFRQRAEKFSQASREHFRAAGTMGDCRGFKVVLEDASPLEDVFPVLRLKAELLGLNACAQVVELGK